MRQTVQGAAQVQISRKYLAHFVECPLLTCISLGEKLPLLAAKLVPARPPKARPVLQPQNRSHRVMSHSSTIDRESLQTLLASAFAVQQSQMDSQSLSPIVKGARRVKSVSLDEDQALPVGNGT